MTHLSEEELIAQAYGEGDKAAVRRHLEECAECSHDYTALESDLAEMKFANHRTATPSTERRVWATLSGSLRAYEPAKWNWLRGSLWRGLSYAAASALLVACAFIGGRLWERKQAQTTARKLPAKAATGGAWSPARARRRGGA